MTLGELIDTLAGWAEQDAEVYVGNQRPGELVSYRGDYSHLALDEAPPSSRPATVASLLKHCKEAVGATFDGYKGGEFVMDRDTPVWVVRDWGDWPGKAIVGFASGNDGRLLLKTVDIQEYR